MIRPILVFVLAALVGVAIAELVRKPAPPPARAASPELAWRADDLANRLRSAE